jgi:hypothetical protein
MDKQEMKARIDACAEARTKEVAATEERMNQENIYFAILRGMLKGDPDEGDRVYGNNYVATVGKYKYPPYKDLLYLIYEPLPAKPDDDTTDGI